MQGKEGTLHPITQFIRELVGIFKDIGFTVAEGPELETEFYNFDALNTPPDHPSRDMQDTFWIKTDKPRDAFINEKGRSDRPVLRTHTSSVQIRYLEAHKDNLPCAIIAPGKVFRNEATDATHEAQFFQLEGMYINKDVSMANLKGTLEHFLKKLYGDDVIIRFRPSYFPFVEPGVEVDMKWKDTWLEMGGAGMMHPNVLKSVGVDPTKWSGFAFGFGLDRLIMRRHNIPDIRMLYSPDLRFIEQFKQS